MTGKDLWVSHETYARVMKLVGEMTIERRKRVTHNEAVQRLLDHYDDSKGE